MWDNVKGMLALPDDPAQRSAAKQGLLNFGASLLAGQGNLGGILGNGLLAGSQGYQAGLAQQQQAAMQKIQQERWNLENQETKAKLDEPMQLQKILAGGGPSIKGPPANLPRLGTAPAAGNAAPASGTAPVQAPASAPAGQADLYQTYLTYGDRLTQAGRPTQAKAYYDLAEKLRPKLKEQRALTVDGKRVLANVYEDGTTQQLDGFAPDLEKLHFEDTGAATMGLDPFTGKPVNTITNTVSPDARLRAAQDERESLRTDKRLRDAAVPTADGMLPDATVAMMAEQYRAGDTSVMQNLGRGAQGAQNIIRLRNEIAKQTKEAGQGGRDLAAQNAEYFGTKAGQRSAGTRIANVEMAVFEAQNLVPLALEASKEVSRSGLLAYGKGQVMFNEQTNNPSMRKFAAANNALVNTYARAISPTGQPTISDKDHARELLSTAYDEPSYEATVRQMQREMTAAQQAPQQVRKAFNDAVTGKGDHGQIKDVKDLPQKKAAPAAYADAEKERRYQEWKRSQGK